MAEEDKTDVRIGSQILKEHDLEFTIENKGEVFTFRYPHPYLISIIEADIARRLGGMPRDAYPPATIDMITACAYVNELLIEKKSPAWFKSAWTCYDQDLILTLFQGYLQFRSEFQDKLRNERFQKLGKGG